MPASVPAPRRPHRRRRCSHGAARRTAWPRCRRPAARRPRRRRQPGDARRLHRLRLRPVHGADPAGDGRLADRLAVLGGRDLHLRRLPRLHQPAEPDPDLGRAPSSRTAGGCCRSRSARRPRAPPASATCTRCGSTPRPPDTYAAARAPGPRRGRKTVAAARRLGIPPGSTLWYDLEAFATSKTDCRESALSFLSAWTRAAARPAATSPASTPAPPPASRCSTTPAPTGRAATRCPTRSGSPTGTAAPTPGRATCAATAGRRTAGCTSTAAGTTRPTAA